MRLAQRAVILIAVAITGPALTGSTMSAAAAASTAKNTAQALTAAIKVKVKTNIAVGNHPVAVAANPSTDRIYATNEADATVSVIKGMGTRLRLLFRWSAAAGSLRPSQ